MSNVRCDLVAENLIKSRLNTTPTLGQMVTNANPTWNLNILRFTRFLKYLFCDINGIGTVKYVDFGLFTLIFN